MADYIKLQEISELKEAMKIKELYGSLLEHLNSIINSEIDYCKKHGIELPHYKRILTEMKKADELIDEIRMKCNNKMPYETPILNANKNNDKTPTSDPN